MASMGAAGRRQPPLNENDSAAAQKRSAAQAAAELIEPGMRVGLGTGSTVAYLLPALAARGLHGLRCVATSPASEAAAIALRLTVETLDQTGELGGGPPPSPDGGLIADYLGPIGDRAALAARLSAVPGVIGHGLFAPEMVSEVLIGEDQGVRRLRGAKP